MSIEVMTLVWKLDVPHHEQSVLLALADHGDDNGANVYPSIGYVAWKTGYSERQIHRIMADLRTREVLIITRAARGKFPAHYRLDLNKLAKKEPYVPRSAIDKTAAVAADESGNPGNTDILSGVGGIEGQGVTPVTSTPDTGGRRGDISGAHADISGAHADIAMSDKPSLVNRHGEPAPEPPRESPQRAGAREGPEKATDNGLHALSERVPCAQCGKPAPTVEPWSGLCGSCRRQANRVLAQPSTPPVPISSEQLAAEHAARLTREREKTALPQEASP